MTQFQPPPEIPGVPMGNAGEVAALRTGNEPWSTCSVVAFILSLLGCLGVTAVFGLILGIVGIVRTKGGIRKGRGLAIAAIPISVVSSTVTVATVLFILANVWPALKFTRDPSTLFDKHASVDAVAAFRDLTTEKFDLSVDTERWHAWLDGINAKHGKLVSVSNPTNQAVPVGEDGMAFSVPGKFVNGRSDIVFTLRMEGAYYRIDDVAVDGVSPRSPD